jgi:hypothetical protein
MFGCPFGREEFPKNQSGNPETCKFFTLKSRFPATFTIISGPDAHLFMVKSPFLVVVPNPVALLTLNRYPELTLKNQ